jgi:hypothetical protein
MTMTESEHRQRAAAVQVAAPDADEAEMLLGFISKARELAFMVREVSAPAAFCFEMGLLELETAWQIRKGQIATIVRG